MIFVLLASVLCWVPQEESAFCALMLGCHREHPADRIACPRCGKREIPGNDAACMGCAAAGNLCRHCGRPRPAAAPVRKRAEPQQDFPTLRKVQQQIAATMKSKAPSTSIGPLSDGRLENAAELPAKGVGYRLSSPDRGTNFGTDEMVFGLMEIAAIFHDLWGEKGEFLVGDIGSEKGGKLQPHQNHQNGRDVDLGLYLCDDQGRPQGNRMVHFDAEGKTKEGGTIRFDAARNWEFIVAMLENARFGEVRAIYLADWLKKLLLDHARGLQSRARTSAQVERLQKLIKEAERVISQPSSSPHDNHIHLSLKCSKEDRKSGGRD